MMVLVQEGRIEGGGLVLPETVELPDGTTVRVTIEVLRRADTHAMTERDTDFTAEPFFGIWADRADMQDSVTWVRERRDVWRHRGSSTD